MDKKFWGILGGLVIIAIVLAIIFSGGGGNTTNAQPTNHVEGSAKYGIKLVEYGDYECPYCAEFYPITNQIASIYANYIQYQFRNFPLTSIHQNALAGARAAEAAALQGKFWQMHDLLYQNNHYDQQTGWVVSGDPLDDYFVGYAKQIGLNIAKFKTDYASDKVNNVIQADMNAGNNLGIDATPTFYLNGQKLNPTSINISYFEKVINAALEKKGVTPPANATPSQTSQPQSSTPTQSVAPQTNKSK